MCVNPALPNRHWYAEPHDPHEPGEGEVRHVQPVPGGVLEEPVSGRAVVHKDLFHGKNIWENMYVHFMFSYQNGHAEAAKGVQRFQALLLGLR